MNEELTSQFAAYATTRHLEGRYRGVRVLEDLINSIPALRPILAAQGMNVDEFLKNVRYRHYAQWTAEEDGLIQDLNFKGYSYRSIANRIGRTRTAVAHRVAMLSRQRIRTYKEVDDGDEQPMDNG